MKTRKLVLIIADVVLLAVCISQWIIGNHDTTKYFDLKDTPDMIVIDTPEEKGITIVCEDGKWYVGADKFPAADNMIADFLDAVSSIRVLDKVGSTGNEAVVERYALNDIKKTVVTVYKDGKVVRTVNIGKEAVSDTQSYITVDGGKDIYLATGSLPYVFDTKTSAIRSEEVFNLDVSEITSVAITNDDGNNWCLSRMGSGEDVAWNISGAEMEIDTLKAASWFGSLAKLKTRNWYEENELPVAEKIATAKIEYAFKTITIDLYAVEKAEGVPQAYYGRSTSVPYPFVVDSDYAQSILKDPQELAK